MAARRSSTAADTAAVVQTDDADRVVLSPDARDSRHEVREVAGGAPITLEHRGRPKPAA